MNLKNLQIPKKPIKKVLIKMIFIFLGFLLGVIFSSQIKNLYLKFFPKKEESKVIKIVSKPLDKYSIENLSKTLIERVNINIEENLSENDSFSSYLFSLNFDPSLRDKETKKITGLLNIPNSENKMPVVILFRGYVDQKIYQTGMGSQRVGEFLAENGYITIAPDFLGYAGSDKEAENIFESRFQTYITALVTLKSISSLPQWDGENIFIWGHSNGGQIALTLLEITGEDIPTVLWAPVSKPFPYSILYYTDESEDLGKLIRKELSYFEQDYDVNKYSIHAFFDRINAPIQIHQGTLDDAVPLDWTNSLVQKLENLEKNIDYLTYPGADHNLQPSWSVAIQKSLDFYNSFLER